MAITEPIRDQNTPRGQLAKTAGHGDRDSCLVQIYPVNITDGMFRLDKDLTTIGRDARNDICLREDGVSRFHARIHNANQRVELADLGSTNGTMVNGRQVQYHLLSNGESVQIGSYLLKFLSADSLETLYHQTVYSAMTIDALTGAFNKSFFLENLRREMARSQRHARPLAVIMADIDHFKSINDRHGHLIGDEVLKEFGRRLLATTRSDDLFARYGGEEFCVLLPECGAKEVLEVAERYRVTIELQPFQTSAGPLCITASFGLALMSITDLQPEQLLAAADQQLYAAKQAGRNRVAALID